MQLALAAPIQAPPTGPYAAEWKVDGHRTAMWRTADTVILQSRSGRAVTSVWMDLAVAGMQLRPGTILDGEACIYADGRLDFSAAQSRAASTPARARELAERLPASYVAFDVISHPDLGDVRMRPWRERRALLVDLVTLLGPPIQVVPATEDREEAALWFEALADTGVEGLVWKLTRGRYEGGRRAWLKQRHTQTLDATVVGYTGPAARPRHLVVKLPDGRTVRSQALTGRLAAEAAEHLAAAGPGRRVRTRDGETYTTCGPGLIVEVAAGTTRHSVATVLRTR
ncbi:RNA ligase family protein [Streptomyces sp. BH055]|uniref:ATP-dependent DNA ligase n=1 Tax=unclassified Streptomyces TaxID=2593676 RepID=UPI003BB68A33